MKTLDKIKRVRILISNNCKNEISYRNMKKILDSEKIHEMNFYYLFYSGCLERIGNGKYIKTNIFYTMSVEEIYAIAQEKIQLMRKKRATNKASNNNLFETKSLSIDEMINHIKLLGYKVLKPTTTFEEI